MNRPRRLLLGVDAGQTVTKAALYAVDGTQVAVARVIAQVDCPHPRWAQRDMDEVWHHFCLAITSVIEQAGPDVTILAVGICGHNDGLYPVDAVGRPVRPAILAMDSRAHRESALLSEGPLGLAALSLTGQTPSAVSPASVLLWLRKHEPDAYERTRWALFCKDWLRLRLTGAVATDTTEASAAFAGLWTRQWDAQALELFDLMDAAGKLPPILSGADIAGTVTAEAASSTGLSEGTPVIVGVHDVDAAAIGVGASTPGAASVVLGTYSINQVLTDRPVIDQRWQARAFVRPQQWMHMSTSPAGAICLEWAVRRLGPYTPMGAPDPRAAVAEVVAGGDRLNAPLFLPFLYGSPHGANVEGSWLGLRGWHDRGDLLAAVLEGVAFNHRTHMDALREKFDIREPVRVSGGGARSPAWTQLLADIVNLPVEVTNSEEAGARGVAMLAGVSAGALTDLPETSGRWVQVVRGHEPRPAHVAHRARRYRRYLAAVEAADAWRPADAPDDDGEAT